MAKQLQSFKLDSGDLIQVEVDVADGGRRVNVGEVPSIEGSFTKAWQRLQPAVSTVVREMEKIAPKEFEVKFGVKLSAEAGAIFTSGSAEANFEITLKWSRSEQSGPK